MIVKRDGAPGEGPVFEVVEVKAGEMSLLSTDTDVVEAEGSYELQWRPDDPDYLDQWEHHVTGIESAWDETRGGEDIVIAVLDSGVTPGPEFGDRLLAGASFIDQGNPHSDPLGHGTAVASVAAAGADNGVGGVGSCPNCSILPVQVAEASGSVPWSAAANGIVWAVDQGADIVNLSFGSQVHSQVLEDAVAYAISRDVIVVAAGGNYGTTTEVYPADLPDVISVAGHDRDYERYGWSSHGPWVDIAAPGCARGVYHGEITSVCGTSFASPWVSGATALLMASVGDLTPVEAEAVLEGTTVDADYVETGRVDASLLIGGGYATLTNVRDKVSARIVDLDGETRGDVVQVDLVVDGELADSTDVDGSTFSLSWDASEADSGVYSVHVDAHDSDGEITRSRAMSIEVIDGTGFADVRAGAFYERGVEWMVAEGITQGTSPTTFSPGASVTRGQLATFLYRFAGSPDVTSGTNFTDVAPTVYYADAVAWMVAEGITTGTSATTFSPNAGVTRAQLAAFLYRFAGSLAVDGGTDFTDVTPGAYFADPVAWMVAEGITTGTSPTTFSPNSAVTRGQLATFLWRLAGEPIV
ncbi:MAG: S8 family serine peptidase [Actinomycetota bacterium]